jgi:putative spermidine/putrescine transport system permease protein
MSGTARTRAALAPWLLLAPGLLLFTCFVIAPLGIMASTSTYQLDRATGLLVPDGLTHYASFLRDPFYLGVLGRTLRLAAITTILAALVGYPVAYAMTKASPRQRASLLLIILAPLLVSVVVRTFGWLVLLGPNGAVNSLLLGLDLIREPLRLLYSETAIVLGLLHVLLPFAILPIFASLRNIDPDLHRAAQNLGAGPAYAFWRVTLPLSLPGIAAGSMIVFALSSSAFVTPAVLGGARLKVMSTLVYQQIMQLADWPRGAAIALILMGISVSTVLAYLRGLERGRSGIVFE